MFLEERFKVNRFQSMVSVLAECPCAAAVVKGDDEYKTVFGIVRFFQTKYGTLVAAEINGLPEGAGDCDQPVIGMHIHSGQQCTGDADDSFKNAMSHYNPKNCPHPYHSGDLPPLFSNGGYAFSVFLTDRFNTNEIVGKTVIIHSKQDDFTTQPSGDSGKKIACGEIKSLR